MGILEFIQVLVAIILGLGMAEILKGFADLLRPGRHAVSPLHLGLAAWLFLQLVQFWWAGWRFAAVRAWEFHELLAYLAGVTILYVAARLVFPDGLADVDLRRYFVAVCGRLWVLIAAFFGCAAVVNVWLIGTPPLSPGPLSQAGLCLVALAAARIRVPWFQAIGLGLITAQLLWRALSLGVR